MKTETSEICKKCKNYTKLGYKGKKYMNCIFIAFRKMMENQGRDYELEFKNLCPYYMEKIVMEQNKKNTKGL